MELTIKDFNEINKKMCDKYSSKFLYLIKEYEDMARNIKIRDFRRLNKLYKKYIDDLILDIVKEINKYYNIDYCVVLSGSLARRSNTLFSDIDINYLTIGNNYNELIDLEDKVNYILKNVLKFRGKDRIHSMVVYLPLISNIKLESVSNNKYPLKLSDGVIYDTCRENAEELMYETYNSTRGLLDVCNYFNDNDTDTKLNEWSYCFECIYNKELFNCYLFNRKVFRKDKGISKLAFSLIKEIEEDDSYLNKNTSEVVNSNFKKIYKTKVLFNFYKVLALFYRIDDNICEFNIKDFYYNSKILNKRIFYYFDKYLEIIQSIQFILNKYGKDLSSHSSEIIVIDSFNRDYKKLTGRDNVILDLNNYKKKLYNYCINSLEGVVR